MRVKNDQINIYIIDYIIYLHAIYLLFSNRSDNEANAGFEFNFKEMIILNRRHGCTVLLLGREIYIVYY